MVVVAFLVGLGRRVVGLRVTGTGEVTGRLVVGLLVVVVVVMRSVRFVVVTLGRVVVFGLAVVVVVVGRRVTAVAG